MSADRTPHAPAPAVLLSGPVAGLLVADPAPVRAGRRPTTVVARQTARKAVRSGAVWGAVFALYVAMTVLSYAATYKTAAERVEVAGTLGSGSSINAIVGQGHQLQTLAGYTEWKCVGILSVVGAVWGLLAGTKLLRGEEEAGRWELLLAGQTTRARAAVQGIAGLGAGLLALWGLTALTTAVIGRSASIQLSAASSLLFALAIVSGAAMFLALGALTSQLAATRRQAAGYAAAALGVSFALRTVADSGTSLAWLRWVSPLGWVEQLRPLTGLDPIALLPIAGFIVVAAGLAAYLAGARDLGASTVPDRTSTRPRTFLLSGSLGLTVRLVRPTVCGWFVAIAAMALVLGADTEQAVKAVQSSPSSQKVLAHLGGAGSAARVYLGVSFLLLTLLVVLIAAGQVTAARQEEAEGRLDHLLVRPVARAGWLAGRVLVATVALVTGGLVAGLLSWIGAIGQHTGVGLPSLLGAGLNVVPPALFLLGIGVLALGLCPRIASAVVYGFLAWSFLVELLGGIVDVNHWVLDSSVFHQMAPAPATAPDWTSGAALLAAGAAAALLGAVALRHRDLVS